MAATHVAWDNSFIAKNIADNLQRPIYSGQKETKTACLRKVSCANIDNARPSCPDCQPKVGQDIYTEESLESFAKYFFYKMAYFQLMPCDFQAIIKPYIDLYIAKLSSQS